MTTAVLGDCERIGSGWLDQPANAWSSLGFAVVGIAVARSGAGLARRQRVDRLVFGVLLVATGAGSWLYHRDPTARSFWHDVTFLAALWFLVVANLSGAFNVGCRSTRLLEAGGIVGLGLVLAVASEATNALAAVLLIGLAASDVILWRPRPPVKTWYAVALTSAAVGAVLYALGRTGSPLCDPESVIQLHGAWHLLAAVALGAYFLAVAPARTGGGGDR